MTATRNDPRYIEYSEIETGESQTPVLHAWFGDMDMGHWADDDEDAFRAAVIDELRHAKADRQYADDEPWSDERLAAEIMIERA